MSATPQISKLSTGGDNDRYFSLATERTQIVISAAAGERPFVVYWGNALGFSAPEELQQLSTRQWAFGGPNIDLPASLSNEAGAGSVAAPGVLAHRNGHDWTIVFTVVRVETVPPATLRIFCEDQNTRMCAHYDLSLDPQSEVLSASTTIINSGDTPLQLDWCAALCMPIDQRFSRVTSFTGRWALEFQEQEAPLVQGGFLRENRAGRTSHDCFPGFILKTDVTNEASGLSAAFHLGWSGNHRLRIDRHADGRAYAQMGELFLPGEMCLAPGQSYTTPTMFAAWSDAGLTALSQSFHEWVRSQTLDQRSRSKPRPVNYNTWEAVYFGHSEERLMALAEKAADIGVERFVLDDGWFGGRRHDRAGLGDWWVSEDVYPKGLAALANRVRELGMEFGIWFEPEMVNPESHLYRTHPDWVLEAPGKEQIPSRNQYALDLTRNEVSEYLFEKIRTIVSANNVAYIKWDMNRDLHHPCSNGIAAVHRQTKAVYALMQRLRDAFPALEIESCSSGGGRCDYGVLKHTDRLWTSDSNDALDRQSIQRGASFFFPLRVLGSHVGPAECHITKRRHSMAFRAATAIFGHMGLELNLLEEPETDLDTLRRAIGLYKAHRNLIHEGDFVRLDTPDYLNVVGAVAKCKDEAIFSCAKIASHPTTLPDRIYLTGLDKTKHYRLRIIWPDHNVSVTAPSIIDIADLGGKGSVFSGEALMAQGMQLPLTFPESCIVYHLSKE